MGFAEYLLQAGVVVNYNLAGCSRFVLDTAISVWYTGKIVRDTIMNREENTTMSRTMLVSKTRDIANPNVVSFEEREKQLRQEKESEKLQQKRDRQSPFGRWTQFNLEHTKPMMALQLKYPKAAAILTFLLDQMDEYNAVMCSYQVLQEVLNVSGETVRKSIKVLKDGGYIAILKSGNSNVYAVNDSIFWKSWGKNKKYSKFPANVLLSMSEQEKDYQISFADIETDKIKSISLKEDGE